MKLSSKKDAPGLWNPLLLLNPSVSEFLGLTSKPPLGSLLDLPRDLQKFGGLLELLLLR